MAPIKHVRTPTLDIAYEDSGPAGGTPVFLMHGFPYDPRSYDQVVPLLTAQGCRTIVPYLRGYGPTRFLSSNTMRSGEQAALGNDLRELMDALKIERAILCGYDWGGRACCIVAALWPERVIGARHRRRLQHARREGLCEAGRCRTGAARLVPVLLLYAARRRRPHGKPPRHREAVVAALVVGEPFDAALFEESARIVRQSGFCRGGDSLLPGALRLRGRRSLARRHRDAACRKAADHRADHCSARGSGRSAARHHPKGMRSISPARISAARCRAPATRCRRMHRGRSRMPCWNLRAVK